jgi:LDH2 family malate/lactate/ureidoglycolate dehydrogenase
MQKVFPASVLVAQTARIFIALGSSPTEADTVARNLVMANLSGHDPHGIGMLPRYVDAVLEGGLTPNASVKTILDTGSLLTLFANVQLAGEPEQAYRTQYQTDGIITRENQNIPSRRDHT